MSLPANAPINWPLHYWLILQIPDDEDAELTQEEMEALEEDMQADFEVAEMIK